jgi:hypothetical protein
VSAFYTLGADCCEVTADNGPELILEVDWTVQVTPVSMAIEIEVALLLLDWARGDDVMW